MDKKRVCIYVRVSSEEQSREGYSIEAQKKKLEEYALFKEWFIYKIYIDAGISAKSIKGRKSFQDMLVDAKNGKFSGILVYKFDRAFRNVKEALITLDELNSMKIDFISLTESIDTTTAMGKFFFTINGAYAQLERELTSERLNFTLDSKFELGMMVGKMPLGYYWDKVNKKVKIDKKKSEMIKDIFSMTLRGIGYKEICEKYKLKPQSYYNIIRNKVYIGFIQFKGREREGIHPHLISEDDFNKVREMLNEK